MVALASAGVFRGHLGDTSRPGAVLPYKDLRERAIPVEVVLPAEFLARASTNPATSPCVGRGRGSDLPADGVA